MHSMETKNWISALVVGVLGLALATLGVVLAYRQLRRTKRPGDVEAAEPESISVCEAVVVAENPRAINASTAEPRDDVQNETETGAMRDNSPATPLPAANEDGRI